MSKKPINILPIKKGPSAGPISLTLVSVVFLFLFTLFVLNKDEVERS